MKAYLVGNNNEGHEYVDLVMADNEGEAVQKFADKWHYTPTWVTELDEDATMEILEVIHTERIVIDATYVVGDRIGVKNEDDS